MRVINTTQCSCTVFNQVDDNTIIKTYLNTLNGREQFINECANYEWYDEVMQTWGEQPITL